MGKGSQTMKTNINKMYNKNSMTGLITREKAQIKLSRYH